MMYHSSHIHIPRNRRPGALRTFYTSSSFGKTGAEPFRRGVLFTTIAGGLLLIGGILTWLGFSSEVFSGKSSMAGPLLIALSILLLIISTRQFIVAKKLRANQNTSQLPQVDQSTVTAMTIDGEDRVDAVTVVMDTVSVDPQSGVTTNTSLPTEDCAPPTYSEVTNMSNSNPSSLPHPSPSENDYVPPPSYSEAMQTTHIVML